MHNKVERIENLENLPLKMIDLVSITHTLRLWFYFLNIVLDCLQLQFFFPKAEAYQLNGL